MTGDSLMQGWLPPGIEIIAAMVLGCVVIGWRTRRMSTTLVSVFAGAVAVLVACRALRDSGISGDVPPQSLWWWTGATGFALTVALAGWRRAGGWWRNGAVLAASLCLLSTGVVINRWIGYFPTVTVALNQLAERPLPYQLDWNEAVAMRARGDRPRHGRVVAIETGSRASDFVHRTEWVYLPPAWFRGTDEPLSAVMMIGGEFASTADWVRAGRAVATADSYAVTHDGSAPLLVFADANGSFLNDTECVNGVRGRAADHLTNDVVPAVVDRFGVTADPPHWSVAGFSSGGTCAVDLAVMHPEVFGRFVDIAGDERPNSGTPTQTVQRLYGGDRRAWAAFDPIEAITRHGWYTQTAGLFIVPDSARGDTAAAIRLCGVGSAHGIRCTVEVRDGRHTWPFAAAAFATALPWLAHAHDSASGDVAT